MLEHLMYVKTWFPKYEVDRAEQTHYAVFGQNGHQGSSFIREVKEEVETPKQTEQKAVAPKLTTAAIEDEFDPFGSDDDEPSEEKQKDLDEHKDKKAKKEKVIAQSIIVLDIKPWDDETDLQEMEKSVRSIETEGLVWGQSKFMPVAYGVNKLQIGCVVDDDKVGTDFLEETICEFKDYVQSVDIVSFNKKS